MSTTKEIKAKGWRRIVKSPISQVVLLIIVSIPLITPYLHAGYFPTHDGEWAVVRLAEMYRALTDGQFPVRYSTYLNYGYGYPLFNFAYPLPYYLGVIPGALIGFVNSIKLIFALSVPLSAIAMWLAVRKIFKNDLAGILAAVLYIYAPYRLVDLYVRGSIGESVSFVLAPLLLYFGILIQERKNNYFLISLFALTLASLVTAHNIMGLYFTPIIILLTVAYMLQSEKRKWISLIASFTLGIALSAFFFIPALIEKSLILLATTPIADRNINWVNPKSLVISSWGYGVPPNKDSFTFQLGIAQIIAMLSFFVIFVKEIILKKIVSKNIFLATLLAIYVLLLILMFPQTGFIWENTPLLKEINYPWTLIGPLIFITALASGLVTTSKKYGKAIAVILILLSIICALPFAKPEKYVNYGDAHYSTNDATTTSSKEYTPLWVKSPPLEMPKQKVMFIGSGAANETVYTSNKIVVNYSANDNGVVQVNTIYYPGWTARINNQDAKISYDNAQGVMQISVTKGSGEIVLVFSETKSRLFADLLSLVSIMVIITLPIYSLYIWRRK